MQDTASTVTVEALLAGTHNFGALKKSESVLSGDPQLVDMLEFGKYYNAYFATGMAALIVMSGLIVYIWMKRYQRTNPMGVMFNLILIQIMLTIRLFMVGLFFQIW